MAYQPNRGNTATSNSSRSATTAGAKTARKSVYKTGLFAPNKEGVKSIGSVQVKEDVLIPAGSYINLYENLERKGETSPVFSLAITEGKLASKSGAAARN